MKIMYVTDNNRILGGAAHTLLRQAALMKAAGHDVVVMLDDSGGKPCEAYRDFCLQRHMDTVCIPIRAVSQPEDIHIPFVLSHFIDTKRLIEQEKPDILHSVQLNVVVELAARELDMPHVMNIYPLIPAFSKVNYMDIFPSYHICDSLYYAGRWEKDFHTNSVCIRTAAGKMERCGSRFQKGQVIRCICVGGIYKNKNQLSVIKACHKAIKNGIPLVLSLYGNYEGNPYGEACIGYIREHGLEAYIALKGFCGDMPEVYRNSDVLICGSTRESYPNVISEALATGAVVISTPVAGVPEVIKDRYNGYLCKGYTPDDIYEKIVELEKDAETGFLDEMMRHAKETYEEVHSPESVSAKLESYYEWLLKNYENKKTVTIDSLKTAFEEIIRIYSEKENLFSDREKVQRKLWYLCHVQDRIREQIRQNKSFYIWGTGKYGKTVYEMVSVFFEDMEIAGFLDSVRTGQYMGKTIYRPDEVISDTNNIILAAAVNGQTDMIEQLEKYGRQYIEDYYILSQRWW